MIIIWSIFLLCYKWMLWKFLCKFVLTFHISHWLLKWSHIVYREGLLRTTDNAFYSAYIGFLDSLYETLQKNVSSLPAGNWPYGQVQLHVVMCGFKISEAETTALGVPWDVERCPWSRGLALQGVLQPWSSLEGRRGRGPEEAMQFSVLILTISLDLLSQPFP